MASLRVVSNIDKKGNSSLGDRFLCEQIFYFWEKLDLSPSLPEISSKENINRNIENYVESRLLVSKVTSVGRI